MTGMPRMVVVLGELGGGLVRMPLLKLGRWVKGAQKFAIGLRDATAAVANFRKRKADLAVDYEHATQHPEDAAGQPIPAAGWVKEIDDAPDASGVLWGAVEFTDRARGLIAAQEYRYVSPGLDFAARDKGTGEPQGLTITHMALTNRPFLEELPALSLTLSEGWVAEAIGEKEKVMGATKIVLSDRAGLKARVVMEDGTESVLPVEGLEPAPKVIVLSEVKRDSNGKFDFASLALGEGVVVAGEVVRAMEAERELDAAVAAGKIAPAQRKFYQGLALSDLAGFRELAKSLTKQIDLGERGFAGGEQMASVQAVDAQIEQLAAAKRKDNAKLGYRESVDLVLSEREDLRKRRVELMA